MDRTIKKIITAAATAAAATISVATVATSPATAATFTYSGTDARLVGFSFENPDWNEPSDIYKDYDSLTELGFLLSVFLGDSWVFFRDVEWGPGSLEAVLFIENTDPTASRVRVPYPIAAGELDVVGATSVPEPSSAIALGALALGAVATKLRRRS